MPIRNNRLPRPRLNDPPALGWQPVLARLLVCAGEHRFGKNMALHRGLDCRLAGPLEAGQRGIERVEFVDVAMPWPIGGHGPP